MLSDRTTPSEFCRAAFELTNDPDFVELEELIKQIEDLDPEFAAIRHPNPDPLSRRTDCKTIWLPLWILCQVPT